MAADMQHSHGIIIRLTKLTNTSLIVHWLTAEAGLIKTVAKGARRPKSPFAGRLDLFFSAELCWTRSRGELHYLREVTPESLRLAIRSNYQTTLMAAYFCKLLESSVVTDYAVPELHNLLQRALDHLDAAGPSSRALLHFEYELARTLGLAHDKRQATEALRHALGKLPSERDLLLGEAYGE